MEFLIRILVGSAAAVAVVAFFGITVFFHELGHFVAARALGLRVDAFSIGFGPAIVQRKRGNTVYKIGWIPFGGYVALPQLDPSGMSTLQGENGEEVPVPSAAWWKRIAVSLAGPAGNIVLAFALAFVIASLPPPDVAPGLHLGGVVVGTVQEGTDADRVGLRANDQILSVMGMPVETWDEFATECHLVSGGKDRSVPLVVSNRVDAAVRTIEAPLTRDKRTGYRDVDGLEAVTLCAVGEVIAGMPAEGVLQKDDLVVSAWGAPLYGSLAFIHAVQKSEGGALPLRILRKGAVLEVELTPVRDSESERWMVGMKPVDVLPAIRPWMKYRRPWRQVKGDVLAVGRMLQALFAPKHKGESGQVAEAVSGPIFILAQMWFGILQSLLVTVGFVRFLNVNLAIINLLPLPVLDGGHILFALYEGITRRTIHPKVLNWLVNIFAALILGLAVFLSLRDSWNLKKLLGRQRDDAPAAAAAATNDATAVDAPATNDAPAAVEGAP